MRNDSLSQGSLICLSYAYFFSTSEPEYAYKRCAYKKTYITLVITSYKLYHFILWNWSKWHFYFKTYFVFMHLRSMIFEKWKCLYFVYSEKCVGRVDIVGEISPK